MEAIITTVATAVEAVSKFILLVLLTQLGKTFTTIGRISTEIGDDEEKGRSIHMVFTMNTLLSSRQFAVRLATLEKEYGQGSIVIFSSKYEGPYTHVKTLGDLKGLCFELETCPRVIIMCSNDFRFDDSIKFIKALDRNRTNIDRVFMYYDELHKYLTAKLRQQIEEIHELDIVKGIIAMTATPMPIWQKTGFWSNIRMIHLDDINKSDYIGYRNMLFNCDDTFFPVPYVRPAAFDFNKLDLDILGYIKHILDKYPEILASGTRTFIPAHIRRFGHKEVRSLVFNKNPEAVIVVLNGEEKTLQFKDHLGNIKTVPLVDPTGSEEVCKTIADAVLRCGLESRPLVITGFLCVGMGQTLTHKTLGSFTSAIFGHMDLTNDEMYQLFGRITGRMLLWEDKYVQTQVYCPTKIMQRCYVMEECARRISTDYNGGLVTEEMYTKTMHDLGDIGRAALENIRPKKEVKTKRPKPPVPATNDDRPFTTIVEVNKFLTDAFKKPHNIKGFHAIEGYQLSTRLTAYYKKKMGELVADDRLTMEFFKKIPLNMNISSTIGKGQQYMVYPVYPTKESPPSDVRYYVRYLKPQAPDNTAS